MFMHVQALYHTNRIPPHVLVKDKAAYLIGK